MAILAQALGHDIFHNHSFINIELVEQDCLVKLIIGEGSVHEGKGYEQSGISHKAFQRGVVRAERQVDAGIGGVEAGVDDHCLIQPDK